MNCDFDPDLDLELARIIRAPRNAVWRAWTDSGALQMVHSRSREAAGRAAGGSARWRPGHIIQRGRRDIRSAYGCCLPCGGTGFQARLDQCDRQRVAASSIHSPSPSPRRSHSSTIPKERTTASSSGTVARRIGNRMPTWDSSKGGELSPSNSPLWWSKRPICSTLPAEVARQATVEAGTALIEAFDDGVDVVPPILGHDRVEGGDGRRVPDVRVAEVDHDRGPGRSRTRTARRGRCCCRRTADRAPRTGRRPVDGAVDRDDVRDSAGEEHHRQHDARRARRSRGCGSRRPRRS